MRTLAIICATILMTAATVPAQTKDDRFYVAATTSVDVGQRGNIPGGPVPAAGLMLGVRLTPAWAIEAEIDRAFRTTSSTSEAFWVSYPPTHSTSREDFERYGIRARFDRTQTAGRGWSAHLVWRTRDASRVNAGFYGGLSARAYDSRVVRTTTFVSPEITLPPTHPSILGEDSTRRLVGGGLTGGVAILVRLAAPFTIVPDVRVTKGFITDDPYTVVRFGLRGMVTF